MAASILLFGASLVVLWHIVSEIDVNELKSAFTAASLRQIGLAVLFTAISYSLLTCYDAIALRQLKLQIPYRTTALASFTSYAVSFTLGFPLLTAGTVRYWIYSPKGVSPGRVASLTVIAGVTFWLGMALVLAWSLIRMADELASLVYTHIWMNQLVGLGAGRLRRRLHDLGLDQAPGREDPGLEAGAAGLSPVAGPDPDRRGRCLRRSRRALRAPARRAQSQLRDLPGGLYLRRHARAWRAMRRAASGSSRPPSCWPCRTIPASRCWARCSSTASAITSCPS